MNSLIEIWQNRCSYYLAKAEEAFFAGDDSAEFHWSALARQWRSAIDELEKEIINDLLNGEE